jgi:DNA-binding NarL/FixJ family response regulator
MQIIYFSTDINTLSEFQGREVEKNSLKFEDIDTLLKWITRLKSYILIADYDSVAKDINKLISSNILPKNIIILERVPAIATGKMLISHGVKAYGNSRMLTHHYTQMINTVTNGKIWTYPELTAALTQSQKESSISSDSKELIDNRLTQKEKEVVYLILEGLTNDAIASKLDITPRTAKAHTSSIFSKLHVNDRVSLVLLLK